MASAVGVVERRAAEEEVVAVRIAGVDGEVPVAVGPVERAIEVGGCAKRLILPVQEDVEEVEIAVCPVDAIEVIIGVDAHQIVEIYLICCLILVVGKVQFVSHLVRKEESLVAGLLIAHGRSAG